MTDRMVLSDSIRNRLQIQTVRSRTIFAADRLNASYFMEAASSSATQLALLEASGVAVSSLADIVDKVWMPNRRALVRAVPGESASPYLRPYDVFDYLPNSSDVVSNLRNRSLTELQISAGTILQTRSGRNLGPCVLADDDLAGYILSDDMIRIEVGDVSTRLFLLAFLQSPSGQSLLRRGRSGSVIDHLTVEDVQSLPIPEVAPDIVKRAVSRMDTAVRLMSEGRNLLRAALVECARQLPLSRRDGRPQDGWEVSSVGIGNRLDAAFNDPMVDRARQDVVKWGGRTLAKLAEAFLPVRYKRYYVEQEYGRPILSGRQLLQTTPINLRHVSDRSFKVPVEYEIKTGMVLFGAVGRAEGRQAWTALVTEDRDGWLASNDVMRLRPRAGIRAGQLWLAIASPQVQIQIKAASFGSVIDHVEPPQVAEIMLPLFDESLSDQVERAWRSFGQASLLAREAIAMIERAWSPSDANS